MTTFLVWYFVFAAVAWAGLGGLWYSSRMFGPAWQRLRGVSMEHLTAAQKKGFLIRHLVATAIVLLPAYGLLGVLFAYMPSALVAVVGAAIVWAVFLLPFAIAENLYSRLPWKLVSIEAGFKLVYFLGLALAYVAAFRIVS